MTKIKAVEPTSGIDEDGRRWETVEVSGKTYRLRSVKVNESDAAFDASQNPDKTFNPRLNQRLLLCSSITSPATTLDDIGEWDIAKLVTLLAAYDRVNTLPAADDEGNA